MNAEKFTNKTLVMRSSNRELSEGDIEGLVCDTPSVLEEGLTFVTNQYRTPEGDRIDLLCTDAHNSLVIVELKAHEDDSALFQALSYYAQLEPIKHFLKSHVAKSLDEERQTRIILVAPSFSLALRQVVSILADAVSIKLVEFFALTTSEGKAAVSFRQVQPGIITKPTKPPTERDHLEYIRDEKVRRYCEEIVQQLRRKGLEVKPVLYRISFKRDGEVHAQIYTRRSFFYVSVWDTKNSKWIEFEGIDSEEKFRQVSGQIENLL